MRTLAEITAIALNAAENAENCADDAGAYAALGAVLAALCGVEFGALVDAFGRACRAGGGAYPERWARAVLGAREALPPVRPAPLVDTSGGAPGELARRAHDVAFDEHRDERTRYRGAVAATLAEVLGLDFERLVLEADAAFNRGWERVPTETTANRHTYAWGGFGAAVVIAFGKNELWGRPDA
jgi:hypothetical protein